MRELFFLIIAENVHGNRKTILWVNFYFAFFSTSRAFAQTLVKVWPLLFKNLNGNFIDDYVDSSQRILRACRRWVCKSLVWEFISSAEHSRKGGWGEKFRIDFQFSSLFSFLPHSYYIFRPKPKSLRLNEKISVATNEIFTNNNNTNSSSSISFFDFRKNRRLRMTMKVDGEELSDSGIDKACDDTLSTGRDSPNRLNVATSSSSTNNNHFDDDFLRNEQLRPHNQQPLPNSASISVENDSNSIECQHRSNGVSQSVNRSNSITNDMNKIMRMNSQFRESHSGQSNQPNQFSAQHEHHTTLPFCSNTYAAFKKGNVVRGILCPSLTNSFR